MSVDHCPARTEPGPHHFVEYEPSHLNRGASMWGTTKSPVAVYCKWCGAWSPLTYPANVTPPDLSDAPAVADTYPNTMACGHPKSALRSSPESAAYCGSCAQQPAKPLRTEQVPNV